MATHIYTSVAANYLPKARVLANGIKKFHPDFVFHVVLCDAVPAWFSLDQEPFDSLIVLADLGLENPPQWIFKHTLVELSTGVKGFALEKLLALPGCTEVLYFDPDIVILSPLTRLLAEFANASILLTPHLAEPEIATGAILDNELSVLRHGIYNLGFIGIKNSPEGGRFASWWTARLNHFCYEDIPGGIFTDQRWADLVPAYFAEHKILRNPGYNVCTWNLTNRTVTGSLADGLLANGEPIAFYHFSGFDSGAQRGMLDKYGQSMHALYELREWYTAECERMGQTELAGIPWAYGFFDNGEPVVNPQRRLYRERADLQAGFPNPYSTLDADRSYLHWFRLNSYDASELQNGSEQPKPIDTPDYRVFVIAAPGDAPFAQDTLDAVLQRTVRSDQIFFVSSPAILPQLAIPASTTHVGLELSRYDDLFAAVLDRFADKDALFIRAGAVPPDKWDLRLAWSSVRQPDIATVSPLDDRLVDKSGRLRSTYGEDFLDRLCYWYSHPADVETGSFSHDCVYVRAAATREIVALDKPVNPRRLLDGSVRLRYSNVLATHICVTWRRTRTTGEAIASHPTDSGALARVRDRIRGYASDKGVVPPFVAQRMTGPNLHILHDWGGGVENWVEHYCNADREHENFVLKAVGSVGLRGTALHLYRAMGDAAPLQTLPLEPGIKATAGSHASYREFLSRIVREYGIQRIIVSSLIGHSLDCLRQPIPTVFVCHDYFPFCPAVNITFNGVCRSCDRTRLTACTQDNPHNRFFSNVPPLEWLHLRKEFETAVKSHGVTLIAPSPSVRDNYTQLAPELAPLFRLIPHGAPAVHSASIHPGLNPGNPLRVVVLGQLAPHKGGLLLECILAELLRFCELLLVGCGDFGKPYAENPKIVVIPEYKREHLPDLLTGLQPDLGLLLSVVPETFSYTLCELQQLRLPVLATNIGSFADRIEDGVTGLLCAPEPAAILDRLRTLAQDRHPLAEIHRNLKDLKHRSVREMLQDYEQLHPTRYSSTRYFQSSELPQLLSGRSLQLFWETAKSRFNENNSVIVAPLGHERQILRLCFSAPAEPIEQLRLDLSSEPGLLLLYDLSLRDHDDRVIWRWNGDIATLESAVHREISFFHAAQDDSHAVLYFPDSDPYVVLPVAPALLQQLTRGGCLEVQCSVPPATDQPGLALSTAQAEQQVRNRMHVRAEELAFRLAAVSAVRDEECERLQHLEVEMQQRNQHILQMESHLAAMQNSVSWRITRPIRGLKALGRKIKSRST